MALDLHRFRRRLAQEEDLGAAFGAAITLAAVAVVTAFIAIAYFVVRTRRRKCHRARRVEACPEEHDVPELTQRTLVIDSNGHGSQSNGAATPCCDPMQSELNAFLREVAEEEVIRAARELNTGIGCRIDRLAQLIQDRLTATGVPASASSSTAPMPPPRCDQPPSAPSAQKPITVDKAISTTLMPAYSSQRRELSFGPTVRQKNLRDPPEKIQGPVLEQETLRSSVECLRQQLTSRIRQTEALARQLKECQAVLRATEEKAASSSSSKKPPKPLELQAVDVVERLKAQSIELQKTISEAQNSGQRWANICREQRSFFTQTERLGSAGRSAITRHPAGEVFLAPLPLLGGCDYDGAAWDVGTAFANPYVCDSWPLEPNSLSQRMQTEWALACIDEDEEGLTEADEDEESMNDYLGDFVPRPPTEDILGDFVPRPPSAEIHTLSLPLPPEGEPPHPGLTGHVSPPSPPSPPPTDTARSL